MSPSSGYTIDDELRLAETVEVLRPGDVRDGKGGRLLLRHLPRDLPCYVSMDIDVLDPAAAPGTCTPVPGGLWPEEAADLVRAVVRRRRVVGLDLVEVNPGRNGGSSSTSVNACRMLVSMLEEVRSRGISALGRGGRARRRGASE